MCKDGNVLCNHFYNEDKQTVQIILMPDIVVINTSYIIANSIMTNIFLLAVSKCYVPPPVLVHF